MEELSNDLVEKIRYLQYRGIIINDSVKSIIDSIQTEKRYEEMVYTIDYVIYQDEYFFLLKHCSSKTLSLIREGSVKFSTSGKVREKENEIIGDLNSIAAYIDKEERLDEFFELEKSLRLKLPENNEAIYDSIVGDYNVMFQILDGARTDQRIKNVSLRQFVESSEFFLSSIPEIYEECPIAIEMSLNYLYEMPKVKDYKLRRGIQKIKKELKNF